MTEPISQNTKELTFSNGETLSVKKLPLRKYAELLNALDKLPMQLEKLDQSKNEEVLMVLPKVIAGCLDEVISIISIATDLKKEKVEELALDEVVNILLAVVEVNRYSEVYENVKKLFARPVTPTKTIVG